MGEPDRGWGDVRTRVGARHRPHGVLTAAMVVLVVVAAVVLARPAVPPASAVIGSSEVGSSPAGEPGAGAGEPEADSEAEAVPEGVDAARVTAGAVALDPRGHRAQGCLALAPAGESRGTVVLDAGHGAPDPGASGRTLDGRLVEEADIVLAVTLAAADRLRAAGVRVVLTRAGDELGARLTPGQFTGGVLTIDGLRAQLTARARCANLARADALVSVHLNAAEDPDVRGAETLYDPDRSFSERNRELASTLHRSVLDAFTRAGRPAVDRGFDPGGAVLARGDLVLLAPASPRVSEPSEVPGALLEPLFLSNREEATFVASPAGRAALAAAIVDGVERYLDTRVP